MQPQKEERAAQSRQDCPTSTKRLWSMTSGGPKLLLEAQTSHHSW
jgi:hypothetical protein